MILDPDNDRMTVNGDDILAFDPDIDWDIRRVEGAGRTHVVPYVILDRARGREESVRPCLARRSVA